MTNRIESNEIANLLDEHAASLALYASQWSTSPDDCVQEAIVKLAGRPERPDNPVAWLFKVVRNQALNELRADQRRKTRETQVAKPDFEKLNPSIQLQTTEENARLVKSLDELPASEKEIVVLRIWSGLTWEEIAELTETSSSSAHRRYVEALSLMKKMLMKKSLAENRVEENHV